MKYLKYSQVKKEYPLFEAMGKNWWLNQIKSGKLRALNTSLNPAEPRYVVSRSELDRFLGALQTGNKKAY